MVHKKADVLVVTALDEVACKDINIFISLLLLPLTIHNMIFFSIGLLNMRGSDIDFNPVFYGYVIVTIDQVYFFVNSDKLPANHQQHFQENKIDVHVKPYKDIQTKFIELVAENSGKIWIGLGSSYALTAKIPEQQKLIEVRFLNSAAVVWRSK